MTTERSPRRRNPKHGTQETHSQARYASFIKGILLDDDLVAHLDFDNTKGDALRQISREYQNLTRDERIVASQLLISRIARRTRIPNLDKGIPTITPEQRTACVEALSIANRLNTNMDLVIRHYNKTIRDAEIVDFGQLSGMFDAADKLAPKFPEPQFDNGFSQLAEDFNVRWRNKLLTMPEKMMNEGKGVYVRDYVFGRLDQTNADLPKFQASRIILNMPEFDLE